MIYILRTIECNGSNPVIGNNSQISKLEFFFTNINNSKNIKNKTNSFALKLKIV